MNSFEKRLTLTLLDREDVMLAQSKRIRSDGYHIQNLEYEIKTLKKEIKKISKSIEELTLKNQLMSLRTNN